MAEPAHEPRREWHDGEERRTVSRNDPTDLVLAGGHVSLHVRQDDVGSDRGDLFASRTDRAFRDARGRHADCTSAYAAVIYRAYTDHLEAGRRLPRYAPPRS